jgi:hypothetical protein
VEQRYEPVSLKRVTEREEPRDGGRNEGRFYQGDRRDNEMRGDPMVKHEEGGSIFAQKRGELIDSCNFFFKEWLLCTLVLEQRRKAPTSAPSVRPS